MGRDILVVRANPAGPKFKGQDDAVHFYKVIQPTCHSFFSNLIESASLDEFIGKIFGLDPASTLISDDSTLNEFTVLGPSVEDYQRKIALVYHVPVSDIEDGNLAQIFDRIWEKRDTGG